MKAVTSIAATRLSTQFLVGAFALSTLALYYSNEMDARAPTAALGHAKAAGYIYGKWCVGKVGCGVACVAPTCGIKIDPMTAQPYCVYPIPGSAGVQSPAATVGTCTGTGLRCNLQNPSPCGFDMTPMCYVDPGGASCSAYCVIAFGTAGPGC